MNAAGGRDVKLLSDTRDAFRDWEHVPSILRAAGHDVSSPVATIAITTFRRLETLTEAVASAMAQRFDRTFEIVVVDNDPESSGPKDLLARLPELSLRNFRYFVNTENLGMFGNFNRAIESARGKWVTILNDDDLLDANYLELMFQTLDGDESVDGLVCHKRFFDQRPGADQARPGDAAPQFHSRRINFASARRMLFGGKGSLGRFARHAGRRLQFEYSFRGQVTRRIHPGKLFWGAILGNGAGFIFRRDKAIELGGFQPEEFPSADYWFFARFAKRYHLRQHRAVAASVRKAENETAKLETVRAAFRNAFALQKALAGREVPAWWMRLAPLIMARDRVDFRDQWAAELPRVEVEKELQISLPKERPRLLYALQTVLRGF